MLEEKYIYPDLLDATKSVCEDDYCRPSSPGWRRYENVLALPYKELHMGPLNVAVDGGCLLADGQIVPNSGCCLNSTMDYPVNEMDEDSVDEDIIWFSGISNTCWGHCVTDSLKHFWFLDSEEYRQNHLHKKIYYFSPKPLSGSYLELIRATGVDLSKLVRLERPTKFRSATVPDNCFESGIPGKVSPFYHSEYLQVIDAIINDVASKGTVSPFGKKIYLARKRDSRDWCSKDVDRILKQNGFVTVYPEDHSFAEQMAIFQNAEEVVGTECSCLHNVVFCRPGTKVVILRKASCINYYQAVLDSARNHNVTYIDCHLSCLCTPGALYAGPFFIYANAAFCSHFGVDKPRFPYKEFKRYLKYFLYPNAAFVRNAMNSETRYGDIFSSEIAGLSSYYAHKFSFIKKMPFFPESVRNRIHTKCVKMAVRNL